MVGKKDSNMYVTEYSQKHAQLTKQPKAATEQPPQKFKSFFKARATHPGPPFCLKVPI